MNVVSFRDFFVLESAKEIGIFNQDAILAKKPADPAKKAAVPQELMEQWAKQLEGVDYEVVVIILTEPDIDAAIKEYKKDPIAYLDKKKAQFEEEKRLASSRVMRIIFNWRAHSPTTPRPMFKSIFDNMSRIIWKPRWDVQISTAAVDIMCNIYFNVGFVLSNNVGIEGVILHELMHVTELHLIRFKRKNNRIVNIVTDIIINSNLRAENIPLASKDPFGKDIQFWMPSPSDTTYIQMGDNAFRRVPNTKGMSPEALFNIVIDSMAEYKTWWEATGKALAAAGKPLPGPKASDLITKEKAGEDLGSIIDVRVGEGDGDGDGSESDEPPEETDPRNPPPSPPPGGKPGKPQDICVRDDFGRRWWWRAKRQEWWVDTGPDADIKLPEKPAGGS